jgi:predicted Zn-ribbon and HTH transcriptional regulator
MSKDEKCPKCRGEMIKGAKGNLERNFACTRGEPNPKVPQIVKVQPYYCKDCGPHRARWKQLEKRAWATD